MDEPDRGGADGLLKPPGPEAGQAPLVLTLGDPLGVGPELLVRALRAGLLPDTAVVCGHAAVLERVARRLGVSTGRLSGLRLLEPDFGPDADAGRCQVAYLELGVRRAMETRGVLVTGPISKARARAAGFAFPGQTEFMAARAGASEVAMLMAGPELRVVLATTHLALRSVPERVTPRAVARAVRLGAVALVRDFGVPRPRLAVCGLNPHAGEQGLFGDEEERCVLPGMERARAELAALGVSAEVAGPLPADTVFWEARRGRFDLVVAMYHDQGLAAIKAVDFLHTVNVTLGLPFVRTSPDHGTAEALVGSGAARLDSYGAAIALGCRIWRNRQATGASGPAGGGARVPSS